MLSFSPVVARIALSLHRHWLIGLFSALGAFLPAATGAQDAAIPGVRIENPPPTVSFDVFEPGPDGLIPEHAPTPPITSTVDAQGVPQAQVGTVSARHIATISGAASGMANPDLDLAKTVDKRKSISNSERAALDWLAHNFIEIGDNAIVWHYTFDHTFNNIVIKSGWPSAFSQADVIKAFLVAYMRTSDAHYIELAKRAAYAYTVACEKGGLRCVVGNVPWFEEIPVPYGYAPMILNGHLYSVVILHKLLDIAYDDRVAEAFKVGVDSAKRMLLRYDTGYWSIYQQRPRLLNVFLALYPEAQDTEIHSVSVSSPSSQPSVLRLGEGQESTYPGNLVWGPGWGDGDSWGRKLTGLAKITILPGRLSVANDPIHAGAMTVSVKYRSPACIPPTVATYDYRARSQAVVSIAPRNIPVAQQEDCPTAVYSLPSALNQWSQVTEFYHDWHTRLVTELWRITRDPKFYATAIRWGRYATAESKLAAQVNIDAIVEPIFTPRESPEDDAAIAAALDNRDPATLTDDEVTTALHRWIELKCLPPRHALSLLTRAGIEADVATPPSCARAMTTRLVTRQQDNINLRLVGTPRAIASAALPVSIAALGNNLFVTTNYNQLSLVNTANLSVTELEVTWETSEGKFVPTGLAFDDKTQTLFIANYLGNNILVAKLDLDRHRVVIHQQLGEGVIVSPEGVAYDEETKILASAQYDGDSVAIFEASDQGWRVRCTAIVPKAHGVAIAGSKVFATSLATQQLLKIDADNCNIIDKMGQLGWDAMAGQFMWPTTVQRLSNGMIGVSDAHTGHVYIVDPEALVVRSWFGGNGPGVSAFNMPYGFSERAGRILVTSTYGNRLVEYNLDGEFLHSYSLDATWPTNYHPDPSRIIGFPNWKSYLGRETKVGMLDGCLRGGYRKLYACDEKRTFTLPEPSDRLLSSGSYFYFTQIAATAKGAVVVSPQNATALYLAAIPSGIALFSTPIGFDSWLDGNKIARPGGSISIDQLAAKFDARAQRLDDAIARSGGLTLSEIVKFLRESDQVTGDNPTARSNVAMAQAVQRGPDTGDSPKVQSDATQTDSTNNDEKSIAEIMNHFRDSVGMEFVAANERCAEEGCGELRRCEISAPMANSLKSESTIDLVRFAIASQMNDCLLRSFLAQEE